MSVRTMARVWAESKHSGTHLLMLLAIADFADDDGNAYPAVGTLATKCRMTSRNANLILAALKTSGELDVRIGKGPRGCNRYGVRLDGVPLKPASPLKAPSPLKPASPTPEAGFPKPLKPTSDEPSLNHHEPSERVRARKKKSLTTSLPENFGISERVVKWSARKGFDRLDEHLEDFVLKAEAKGYTYSNWDTALMRAINEDWAQVRKSGRSAALPDSDHVFKA